MLTDHPATSRGSELACLREYVIHPHAAAVKHVDEVSLPPPQKKFLLPVMKKSPECNVVAKEFTSKGGDFEMHDGKRCIGILPFNEC